MSLSHEHPTRIQEDFSSWIAATSEPGDLKLGIDGYRFEDLFDPSKLASLYALFEAEFAQHGGDAYAKFEAYRASKGEGMTPEAVSEALLGKAPFVSRFVARLFRVEAELAEKRDATSGRQILWTFKREFAKKRLFKTSAGQAFAARAGGLEGDALRTLARLVAEGALVGAGAERSLLGSGTEDEETTIAAATMKLVEVDEIARKAAKSGGADWTTELHARVADVRAKLLLLEAGTPGLDALRAALATAGASASDEEDANVVALALDSIESWLGTRRADHHDRAHKWQTLHAPHATDPMNLVQIRRPNKELPELFVGPEDERRPREGFALTDRRGSSRDIEAHVDYCLYCHDRDKDSCSKGLRDNKTKAIKKNGLGVELAGCPLGEKISEMHLMRQQGDVLASMALVTIDNPMMPGTGHRICNDCMKACVFQKQEPVNIPEVETNVLTDVLGLPFGFEIYGFMTRWNPLNIDRPHARPYNGKNVLVVGLGPAGYTLAHHLSEEGFAVAAVDGLKIEPLPKELTGDETHAPRPIRDFKKMYEELDERILLGFGGVSEYGITVRWDKNFLTVVYVTLARKRNLRIHGGVRFGGALDLDDAWKLGFDHVAIAAGAGRPTLIPLKNNLARGIRKASDFLMALQLSGAYKRSALANLQVRLPAIVIGGGLTAIDTATELIAYYPIQVEKTAERVARLITERGDKALVDLFDDEERAFIAEQLGHAALIREEREAAEREGRAPDLGKLIDQWGGVSIAYRKRVIDSPAYRLNHEEVAKSLEEGVRYIENLAPFEAVLDDKEAVKALKFERQALGEDGKWTNTREVVELPARTVCVAAGTQPNVTYEREQPGTFAFDKWKNFFQPHTAVVDASGKLVVEPAANAADGFFTSFNDGKHAVSFYGDNHPHYAGSVVKAMASAKDAYPSVRALFAHDFAKLGDEPQAAREARRRDLFARLDDEFKAIVHDVRRLTPTIIEVVVRAPAAARKFEPGQFYRLQNFESKSQLVDGTRLAMEGIALTGAWVDKEKGLLSLIALEMGVSTRLLSGLQIGEEVVVMGPTGTPTEIPANETVLLAGGGLGNAVLFSIAKAMRAKGAKVIYFAGYRRGEDVFKQEEIVGSTDQVIWCTDAGAEIAPSRPQDHHFRGNIVKAMIAYAERKFGDEIAPLFEVTRIIAIGSDKMMNAVREARHGVLEPHLNKKHAAIGSINSPMQCMMKEVCAQCLQKHVDPETGKETFIFSCFNQDQELDRVDFRNLAARLRANTVQEKLSNAWLDRIFAQKPELRRV